MKKRQRAIIFVLIAIIIALLFTIWKIRTPKKIIEKPKEEVKENKPDIVIEDREIKEENFTGTISDIKSSGPLASKAKAYIDQTLSDFKKMADTDVPDMRKKFGTDSPTANYEIILKATYFKGIKTDSIIIDQSFYTGGANTNSSYKVFTASLSNREILKLSDVILASKQSEFLSFLKKSLLAWRPEGMTEQVVFPDEVNNLTFSSLENWSFGKNNLIIYFDKYAIGPGALGSIAFPLPYSKIGDFLLK